MEAPREMRWSDKTLGPDGPWNAIKVNLGNGQDVTVYAGKMWESYFPGATYCGNTATAGQPCYAQEAGAVYSEVAGTGDDPPVALSASAYYTPYMNAVGSSAKRWNDRIALGTDSSDWNSIRVDNFELALMDDTQLRYPNGNDYPVFAGCLSFGAAPDVVNHSFRTGPELAGAVNNSLLVGALYTDHQIASQTFGMHIGSAASHQVPGSLWIGGYDQNRAMNDMLSLPIPDPYYEFGNAPLADISIAVVKGGSPFPWDSKGGLLASGNSSIGSRLDITIDPCIPYINLPQSTCEAIAAEIPVKLDEGLGLYLWDTESPEYPRIVQSPSVLTFTFVDINNNLRRVNISVPFSHLNLTLTQPLIDRPTPYFPCNAASGGAYALGRAFLQDTFFGANLKTAVYFLSQAPGPNLNTENMRTMDDDGRTLDASENDWITSWDGYWTPLPEAQKGSSNSTSSTGIVKGNDSIDDGSIIGAAVGGGVGLLVLIIISFIIWRYKKRDKGLSLCGLALIKDKTTAQNVEDNINAVEEPKTPVGHSQGVVREPGPTVWQLPAHVTDRATEMETPYVVHEMPTNHIGTYSQYCTN
ncbi:hypothetical protein F4811DRAFT_571104 [Daldinia bambusicola]|nr:hypothetical protein F4811DRAFT_571104 [Daldinia bambusicola]